jgi:hypothetical protein
VIPSKTNDVASEWLVESVRVARGTSEKWCGVYRRLLSRPSSRPNTANQGKGRRYSFCSARLMHYVFSSSHQPARYFSTCGHMLQLQRLSKTNCRLGSNLSQRTNKYVLKVGQTRLRPGRESVGRENFRVRNFVCCI